MISSEAIIIYDSDHPGAFNNRCFEASYAHEGPGHSFTVALAREANRRGYKIMTGDIFLQNFKQYSGSSYCISDMYSARTNAILKSGTIPFLCLCMESPLIAKDFYMHIKSKAGRFKFNMQFRGTADRLLKTGTHFSNMYYPVDSKNQLPLSSWSGRKYLIMINRNKRAFFFKFDSLKNALRSVLSRVKLIIQRSIDPWIRSKELYKDRIEALYFFSSNPGFHLYGQGWENQIPGFSKRYHQAARKCYKGTLNFDEKLNTMSQYKFAICFENCSFPGYVTEKIFDCFLAGTIPVYYGAPDINSFVPPESFIDFRKFKDFKELDDYLKAIDEITAMKMLKAASDFLSSAQFDRHYQPNVIHDIFEKLEGISQSQSPAKA